MEPGGLEATRAELAALLNIVSKYHRKTIEDEDLRDRFRGVFRSWASAVEPAVRSLVKNRRDVLKLAGELEALAKLASKRRPVTDYRSRLRRAIELANNIALYLPPPGAPPPVAPRTGSGELFVPGIPDLTVASVPNPLFGWRSRIAAFTTENPFDFSVFIMIRYRRRNERLVAAVKTTLAELGLNGILASDHSLTDDLYNPIACLLCCSKGLAIFDQPEPAQTINPNVTYELAMMHLLGRECRILKHKKLKVLATDFLMKLYLPFSTVKEAVQHIRNWLGEGS